MKNFMSNYDFNSPNAYKYLEKYGCFIRLTSDTNKYVAIKFIKNGQEGLVSAVQNDDGTISISKYFAEYIPYMSEEDQKRIKVGFEKWQEDLMVGRS